MRAHRTSVPLLLALAAAWPWAAQAQIYANGASDGARLVLSNHASDETPLLLIEAPPPPPAAASAPTATAVTPPAATASAPLAGVVLRNATPTRVPAAQLSTLIARIAQEHAVAPTLVKAIIAAESAFDARAVSPKGAKGLMQLMPDTARRFGVRDAFSDEQNLRGGTAYLRWLLDFFAGDVTLAVAAYNAGEGAVLRAGRRIPDIAETRDYVPKVLAYQAHYARDGRDARNSR